MTASIINSMQQSFGSWFYVVMDMGVANIEVAQIVWAETEKFSKAQNVDKAGLQKVRQLLAQLVIAQGGEGFSSPKGLPSVSDPIYGAEVTALEQIVINAQNAVAANSQQAHLLIWKAGPAGTNGPYQPPSPWPSVAAPVHALRVHLGPDDVFDVFSGIPPAGSSGPAFISALTGIGTPLSVPSPKPAELEGHPRWGLTLFAVALALFSVAALWAYGAGLGARLGAETYIAPATRCEVENSAQIAIDWLPDSACSTNFQAALARIENGEAELPGDWVAQWALVIGALRDGALSLSYALTLAFVAIAVLFVSAGVGIWGRPMGAIIDQRYRMSLTLMQAVLWAVLILGAWVVLALFNIGSARAISGNVFPTIPGELWMVLGLSGASPFISRIISGNALIGPAAPNADSSYLKHNTSPKHAKLTDMVLKETEDSRPVIDTNRIQYCAMTGILIAAYAAQLYNNVRVLQPAQLINAADGTLIFQTMPPIAGSFLPLLAVSHLALWGAKYNDKREAAPAAEPQR